MADDGDTTDAWMLTVADRTLVMTKSGVNRLRFAVLLLFCRAHGRFPRTPEEIDDVAVTRVARQLGMKPKDHGDDDVASRTWKRHRAEIRDTLGFREATVADAGALEIWLRDQIPSVGVILDQLTALLVTRCRKLSLEAPTPDRVDRIARAAIRAHEERFHTTILGRLSSETRTRLDALLRPAESKPENTDADPATQPVPALLVRMRADPGRPGLAGVQDALVRLDLVREIELPPGLFDGVLPHEHGEHEDVWGVWR